MCMIHSLASIFIWKYRFLPTLDSFLAICLSFLFKLFKIFFNGQVTNTWKSDTAPNTVFFHSVFNECIYYYYCARIHVTSHCYITNRLAWLTSYTFFFQIGVYMTQFRLVSLMWMHTCRNGESILHAHKDICKEISYYDLLYKCVSRHFIITGIWPHRCYNFISHLT